MKRDKDHFDELYWSWNYAIRDRTLDGKEMRVIVSFDEEEWLLVVTAFFIEKGR